MKDRGQKNILTPLGSITFIRTRFQNKETGETAYLLDRILGWEPHTRISDGAAAGMLEAAAQASYEKAGGNACLGQEGVSRETVMRRVHSIEAPSEGRKEASKKRKEEYLYVEADEDHIALQYKEKKGDIKRYKGHADNGQIVKLVYVQEGYADGGEDEKRDRNAGCGVCMSSRPMGWCRQGADSLSHIRIYWKNGGDILELVKQQKERGTGEQPEEERYYSASEILSWEKKHSKANGKYIRSAAGKHKQRDFREASLS